MSDYRREIAELTRRKNQQLQIAEAASTRPAQLKAEGKADGYQSAIDVLRDMTQRGRPDE